MKLREFYYDLPEELIAQHPLNNREDSRLLVLDRLTGELEHRKFTDIVEYLNSGDCLVLNDTKVIPARLYGNRLGKEEAIEILLLKRLEDNCWECLVRPGKKVRPGSIIEFGSGILKADVLSIAEDGTRIIKFHYEGIFEEILDQLGEMPLPPYITEKLSDKSRYQTVYARHKGSAAAPTAGLHFTEHLLEEIYNKGVSLAYITLHVGLGTFRPVKADNILDHHMHSEYFNISEEASNTINNCRENGGKIISVGTTSTRALETVAAKNGFISPASGWTDIFIYPGYEFKIIDKLITNFHLPESTLLMLVSALSNKDNVFKAYDEAIKQRYRFFSFGDAMFIK
ncbi:MAG: tRNA preQ1(34) S-adenosylmethionine ribosyltransferase-isomerase QueA [Tissierellaceae bacterium]|nr:tRNA preQ1(34) S-adenosylmethionine ribosyltransferase-isomerase QueA [Tissierellaceae bacterium]